VDRWRLTAAALRNIKAALVSGTTLSFRFILQNAQYNTIVNDGTCFRLPKKI